MLIYCAVFLSVFAAVALAGAALEHVRQVNGERRYERLRKYLVWR